MPGETPGLAESERIARAWEPLAELVAAVQLHDNHGEKDEHLPPYDGSIDWQTAIKLLITAPDAANVPLTLELKEKSGPDASGTAELLAAARPALDRTEKVWG